MQTFISIISVDFSMFYKFFISLQMKIFAIITYKHGIYYLPKYFSRDIRLRILRN